jgi:hypothetical protein
MADSIQTPAGGSDGAAVLPIDPACDLHVLGVRYRQYKTADGGDLYLTRYGRPFAEQLQPENWYAGDWLARNRRPLEGTSTVYRLRTRPTARPSIEVVIKWSRVGQDVPLRTNTIDTFLGTEFNSPFEEFALVEELRAGKFGPPEIRVLTHRPLAIYAPSEKLQLWQTGRSRYKIASKLRRHPGIEIDILRQYIMIYEWVKGIDAAQWWQRRGWPTETLHALMTRVTAEFREKGYYVADMKPAHVIVRPRGDALLERGGQLAYAMVDFELMQRTETHQKLKSMLSRADYLVRQRDRFTMPSQGPLPPNLHHQAVFGVDYIQGRVQSTDGALWVVGNDPQLFDYYQPERWRQTPRVRMSENHQVYFTRSKDDILLVWKTSRVGDPPELAEEDRARGETAAFLRYGYNSPFEEFAFALELASLGVPVTQPRAIYMTGTCTPPGEGDEFDESRFLSHAAMTTPDGLPLLRRDHDYIKIWGFWNGPIEAIVEGAQAQLRCLNLESAYQEDLLSAGHMNRLMDGMCALLLRHGYEALNLEPHHLLLSFKPDNTLALDAEGRPEVRLCNFETIRRIRPL